MKMRDSEIFNNYIRLAEDAGLIGEDELQKTADPSDKTRYDRYSFSDFEALYGHKFTPNEKEGESIVEVAHPETAVAVPAYDAMNSVVENLHQRNNIMTYVALKDPDGHLVQRRYVSASQKLINSLVSAGFKMDNINENGLMSLADSCAGRLKKKSESLAFKKVAFTPLIYGAISLLGALGYLSYGDTSVQNVSANSQLVLDRLGELGSKSYANSIRLEVTALKELSDMFAQQKGAIVANSIDDVVNQSATDKAKAMIDLVDKYKQQQSRVAMMIPRWRIAIDSSVNTQSEAVPDSIQKMKSFFGGALPDAWQAYFQDGGSADQRELMDELEALSGAIKESARVVGGVNQMARGQAGEIQKKINEREQDQQDYNVDGMFQSEESALTGKELKDAVEQTLSRDFGNS